MSPAQMFAMRVHRFMHDHGVRQEALRAISLASYHHAQPNPRAVMYGRPLTAETTTTRAGSSSRSTCSTAARRTTAPRRVMLITAERAQDLTQKPAYLLAAAQGSDHRRPRRSHNAPDYASSNFKTVAPRLYAMAELDPKDVDVLQSYENFTGGVLMSLVEHGFCDRRRGRTSSSPSENLLAPDGKLPLNTSGGNLAECYMHGLELNIEAVRQIRGDSTCQVPDAVDLDGLLGSDGDARQLVHLRQRGDTVSTTP